MKVAFIELEFDRVDKFHKDFLTPITQVSFHTRNAIEKKEKEN